MATFSDSSSNTDTSCMIIVPESSFFKEKGALELPSPECVRRINRNTGNPSATDVNRPPPVIMKELGLVVKYGYLVTVVEAQTQMMVREQLRGKVPVPEVFGWTRDNEQVFIYMSLIEGETLMDRWGGMDEAERDEVCRELQGMVKAWRGLKQDSQEMFVGSLNKQPLNDWFLWGRDELTGPFIGSDAAQQFQHKFPVNIEGEVPIMFTHDDLCPPNILLTSGPNPKVAAVIDWGQAGWYPAYWEYCKARRVQLMPEKFDATLQQEWWDKYLPKILDAVDEEAEWLPFLRFVLSTGN